MRWQRDRGARDEQAAERDDDATARDERASGRDDAARSRDTTADTRDEQFVDREIQLRQLLSATEFRHAAENARREQLARQHPVDDEVAAGQAEIDRETRRSERALDSAAATELRAGLDWLHDTYLRDTRRDRHASADDRGGGRSDRIAATQDRSEADADRQQSDVDDARYH